MNQEQLDAIKNELHQNPQLYNEVGLRAVTNMIFGIAKKLNISAQELMEMATKPSQEQMEEVATLSLHNLLTKNDK